MHQLWCACSLSLPFATSTQIKRMYVREHHARARTPDIGWWNYISHSALKPTNARVRTRTRRLSLVIPSQVQTHRMHCPLLTQSPSPPRKHSPIQRYRKKELMLPRRRQRHLQMLTRIPSRRQRHFPIPRHRKKEPMRPRRRQTHLRMLSPHRTHSPIQRHRKKEPMLPRRRQRHLQMLTRIPSPPRKHFPIPRQRDRRQKRMPMCRRPKHSRSQKMALLRWCLMQKHGTHTPGPLQTFAKQ